MNSRRNQYGLIPAFDRLFDEFTGRDLFSMKSPNGNAPAVNIKETDEGYHLEVVAPGMKRGDFNVTVEKDVLTISSEREEKHEETDEAGRYTRREYFQSSFRRSFHLPESADHSQINAKYEDGILNVSIPKREEAKPQPPRTIEIG